MLVLSAALIVLGLSDETEMRIRVVDKDRKPIAGATVQASIWSESKKPPNTKYTTDKDGVATVVRPKALQIVRIWVSKQGYATLVRGWETGKHDNGKLIPAAFEFPMRKAGTAGGRRRRF